MPTYEYACTSCGRHLEIVQSFSDEALEVCEECGGKLRRVFHPVGVLFKGSGFYRNDAGSRSKEKSAAKKADGASESPKTDKSDSKQTPKPPTSPTKGNQPSASEKSA